MASPERVDTGKPEQKILDDIIERIVDASRPERIIMFGSAASGTMGKDSDIDLLVVKSGVHRRKTTAEIYRRMKGAGYPVDVIVAHPEDLDRFADAQSMVFQAAIRQGRIVYDT
jgi:uncharacterized protein